VLADADPLANRGRQQAERRRHFAQSTPSSFGTSAGKFLARLYSFDVPPAAHSLDVDYVFGFNFVGLLFPGEAPNPPLASVVSAMQHCWARFALAGDPNGGTEPAWPAYDAASDQNLAIAANLSVESGLSRADCDFWAGIFARDE
jgi:carboxylesterase type B